MQGQSTRAWTWAFAEIAVVVAGILIAFALNSWWENRAAAAREQAHLQALRSDFEVNLVQLEGQAERHDRISRASGELLLIARGARSVRPDSVDQLLGQVFNSARFAPVMGAYEGLVNSGGLTQIRDDSLRSALATFASSLETRYSEDFAMAMYIDFNLTFFGQLGWADVVIGNVLNLLGEQADALDASDVPGTGWNHTLLEDPAFRDHLGMRFLNGTGLAVEYRSLAAQAREILNRVEASIDQLPPPPPDTTSSP